MLVHDAAVRPRRWRLVAVTLCVAVGILTHYLFVLPLLAALVWLAVSSAVPRAIRLQVGAAAVVGLAAIAPWAGVLAEQYSAERFGWIDDFDPLKGLYLYGTLFDPGVAALLDRADVVRRPAGGLARRPGTGRRRGGLPLAARGRGPALRAPDGRAGCRGVRHLGSRARHLQHEEPPARGALCRDCRRGAAGRAASPARARGRGNRVGLAVAATLEAPPVAPPADRYAQVLVEEGWQREDVIVLIADFYGFRSPIGWYLPGRPFLELVDLDADRRRAFLIVQGERSWAGLGRHRPDFGVRRIGNVFIAPLGPDERELETLVELGGKLVRARG